MNYPISIERDLQQEKMRSDSKTFTYWSLLGIPPGSDSEEIKKAYRKEAMRWHPDMNGNDRNAEERFKWVNQAFMVLKDPNSRLQWEAAGRPTIEIKEKTVARKETKSVEKQTTSEANDFYEEEKNTNKRPNFDTAEKLMMAIVMSFGMLIVNIFR